MRQWGKSSNSEYVLQNKANISNHRGYCGDHGRVRGRGRGENYYSYNRNKNVESNSTVGDKTTSYAGQDKLKIQCRWCDRSGHYPSKCRTKLYNNQVERANVAEAEDNLLLASKEGMDVWILEAWIY